MKKILSCVLLAAMVMAMTGCASLFDTEYRNVWQYEAEASVGAEEPVGAPVSSITNYNSLKQAILQLVSERAESAELQFQNYDGSITQDISAACWEVKSSTALGAFAVDYISYDLSRIVSFYQGSIYITYKRSADQIAAVETVVNLSDMAQKLDEALRQNKTYLVLETTVASATADTVRDGLEQAYYSDPLACPVLPSMDVGIYPESGVSRIFEITLSYGVDGETLSSLRQELALAVDAMAQSVGAGGAVSVRDRVYDLGQYVMDVCHLDETAGSTAWDALMSGTANSEGLAMALMAGCQAMGVDCSLVRGRLDGEDHAWNIVTIDGQSYHVDVSNWGAGEENVFLVSDDMLWGSYWWDTGVYPACPRSYAAQQEAMSSLEPNG